MSNLITFIFLTHGTYTHTHTFIIIIIIYSLLCQKYFHISMQHWLRNCQYIFLFSQLSLSCKGKKDFKIDYQVNQAKLKFNCSQTILLFIVCMPLCTVGIPSFTVLLHLLTQLFAWQLGNFDIARRFLVLWMYTYARTWIEYILNWNWEIF